MSDPYRDRVGVFSRARYIALLAFAASMTVVGRHLPRTDWTQLQHGVLLLQHGQWAHLFSDRPWLSQDGPLMYLALWLLHVNKAATILLGVASLPVAVYLAERVAGRSLGWWPLLVAPMWVQAAVVLHPDDLWGITLLLAALLLRQRGNLWAGAVVGVAVCVEPWTALVAALLVADWWYTVRSTSLAAAVVVACWLPFVIADPATVRSASITREVTQLSTLHFLGLHSAGQGWVRPLQLMACLCAVGWVMRRNPAAALLVGCSVRLLLDPQEFAYYTVGVMVGALLVGGRWVWIAVAVWGVALTDDARLWPLFATLLITLTIAGVNSMPRGRGDEKLWNHGDRANASGVGVLPTPGPELTGQR